MIMSFSSYIIFLLYVALLIIGVVQCKKHSFVLGFYFFIIMMVSQLYGRISPYIIRSFLENKHMEMGREEWMSIGHWVIFFSLIPRVIEVIALAILVFGLYRMWNERKALTNV